MPTTLEIDMADPRRAPFYKGMELQRNDEYGRLRRQHLLHKKALEDKLIRVPLPTDRQIKILDSGTGDGLWMLDAADEYPNATFVGTDVQPAHFEQIKDLPASISFKVQDMLDSWPAEYQGQYDIVHQRYCLAQFSAERDAEMVQSLFNLLAPGGYIQLVEADMLSFETGDDHPGFTKFVEFNSKAFPDAKMNPSPGPGIKQWLMDAGASDVSENVFSFGMGAAASDEWMQKETTDNINAILANFSTICNKIPNYWYTPEDFEALNAAILQEMVTTGNTWKFWVVTARKP